MNTRLILNQQKAESLYRLLTHLIENYEPENIAEKLIEDHIKDVYEKLGKKVRASYVKEYSIVLNPKEAKAYYIFFNQNKIDLGLGFAYEMNLVQSHIHLIDKVYA